MKIAVVAPTWGRETSSDQSYLAALARSLAGQHTVRILAAPEPPAPANPVSRPRPVNPASLAGGGASRSGAHAARPASPADLAVETIRPSAMDRLPSWLAASAFGQPLMRWALAPALDELIAWADSVVVPLSPDPLAQAAAHRARIANKLALVPSTTGEPARADRGLARAARAVFTGTRTGARALIVAGWAPDRIAITGLIPESASTPEPALFRRRYRVPGPFILYDGPTRDAAYELMRSAVGLVWHKRPEATFVFLAPTADGRRVTRTSHAGHMLHISGHDDSERASAFASCAVACAAGPLATSGALVADAWHRARPVVAVDSPAARELLADGTGGCLAPADAHELAAALLRLLSDPARADRLGLEGQKRLRETHAPARLHELFTERLDHRERAVLPALPPPAWRAPEPQVRAQ